MNTSRPSASCRTERRRPSKRPSRPLRQARGPVRAKKDLLDVTLPGPGAVNRRAPSGAAGAGGNHRHLQGARLFVRRRTGDRNVLLQFRGTELPPRSPRRWTRWTRCSSKTACCCGRHTSPNQIRIMESRTPPLRYVVYGKVYRNDTPDATHSPMFHQLELFAVDTNITFGDLKGTLDYFLKRFFGENAPERASGRAISRSPSPAPKSISTARSAAARAAASASRPASSKCWGAA